MSEAGNKGELIKAMQRLYRLADDSLAGRELSSPQRRFYLKHAEAWHERMFHLSMTILSEARSLNRLAQEVALTRATKIPAEALLKTLSFPLFFDAELVRALDCWEVDHELAYEQFGSRYSFRPAGEIL